MAESKVEGLKLIGWRQGVGIAKGLIKAKFWFGQDDNKESDLIKLQKMLHNSLDVAYVDENGEVQLLGEFMIQMITINRDGNYTFKFAGEESEDMAAALSRMEFAETTLLFKKHVDEQGNEDED